MFDLGGKTALVTGASGGIGAAIAKALFAQGATVALSGTRVEALEKLAAELGGEKEGDVLGKLGILGAGVSGGLGPVAGVIEKIAAGGPFLVGGAGFP